MTTAQTTSRDGVYFQQGLEADFVFLRDHPNCLGICQIRTAAGVVYARRDDLCFDVQPQKPQTDL